MCKPFFKFITLQVAFCFVLFLLSLQLTAQKADIILFNGKIFTADSTQSFVSAIAIKGNKIMTTGTDAVIKKLAANNTKQINLQGKTVVPGFNDQHDHPAFEQSAAPLSYHYSETNIMGPSKGAVLDSIAHLISVAKKGQWITGMMGITIFFDTSMRRSLDSLAPENPVALQNWWGHGIVTNAKGLEAVGLSDTAKDPIGGWYEHNSEGRIAAVQQNAQSPFWITINQSYPDAVVRLMQGFGQQQLQGGITSTLFMGAGFTHALATRVLQRAKIPQRIRFVAWPRSTTNGRQLSEWPLAPTYPKSNSIISGIKYVIDGTSIEGNALRSQPYTKRGTGTGRLNYPLDTMKQILREALTTHRQLLMHITADSSFGIVLKLMSELGTPEQWHPLRVRIEHNTVGPIPPAQRKMVKDLGLVMMHTPKYAQSSPLRSLIDYGIPVGIAPDGTVNPFFEIFMMTSRQTNPNENISIAEAVIAYTKTNAFAEFKEKEKGTLTKGMLADLAVLSQDIFTIPPQQLMTTHSVLTMIDGKIVFEKK